MRLTHKNFLKHLGVCAIGITTILSVAACGQGGNNQGSSTTSSVNESNLGTDSPTIGIATGKTQSKEYESITICVSSLWGNLSPFQTTQGMGNDFVRLLYDRLVYQTGDGRFVGQAAKNWKVEEDGMTWNIELHDNIYDSEGNHITSSDIVWFTEEYMERGLKPAFNKINKVEQTGDYTLKIILKEDVVGAIESILTNIYAVSRDAFENSADEMATSVVSTSPYLVSDYVAGASLTFKKRPDYWKNDDDTKDPALACNVEVVTYQVISESSQVQIALETGVVDGSSVNSTVLEAFMGNDNYSIYQAPGSNGCQMFFSGDESRNIATDVNLRKAIAYCIDAQGVIVGALGGHGEVMHDASVRVNLGYEESWDEEEYFPYDLNVAKDYLEQSNYKGEELVLMTSVGSNSETVAQILQGYMLSVGINCKLTILDSALFSASRFDGAQYDMIMVNAGAGSLSAFWGNRFDCNAYELGDATARNDEVLTEMIYSTWTNAGFTKENKDAVRSYINDNTYAYGIYLPVVSNVYNKRLGIVELVQSSTGNIDYVACVYN